MKSSEGDEDLPEGWMRCFSKSMKGKIYYFNTLTGESLWEHPEAFLIDEETEKVSIPVKSKQEDPLQISSNDSKSLNWSKIEVKSVGNLNSGSGTKFSGQIKFLSEKNLAKEVNFVSDSSSASETRSSVERHSNGERKLKPITKVLKKPKNSLKKDGKGTKVEKNLAVKNAVRLKDALSFMTGKTDSLNNLNGKVKAKNIKRVSNGSVSIDSLDKTKPNKVYGHVKRQIGQNVPCGKSPTGKVQNKSLENDRSFKTFNDLLSGDLKNNGGGKSSAQLRTVENSHKEKRRTLNPLKTLKKNQLSEINIKTDEPRTTVWNYKIPKNSQKSAPKEINANDAKSTNFDIFTPSHSSLEQYSFEITLKDSSRTVRSVDSLSERSSSSWSVSDVAMTGTMEGERVDGQRDEIGCTPDGGVEEDMEVDNVEFMSKKILKQIESIRVEKIEVPKMDCDYTESSTVEIKEGSLFIILDTNILLSNLKLVRELKDSPIPGAGRPTVIIPWMVTQELDRLKSAPASRFHEFGDDERKPRISLNILARKAIAFLHNCFSENHPRIRGQTVYEANQHIEGLVEETNDDNILHCCLLLKAKAPQAKTVLLSNDRNLLNKSIVNGVKAFDSKTLINGLRDLFQSGNIIVHKDHFKEYFKVVENQEYLAERRKKADDLVCELQCILREAFAAIVEKEMKEAYDELWLTVIKIKPPWTLLDTMDLLDKHWIAVFGHLIQRNLKANILDLKKKFSSGDATLRDLDTAGQLIELGYHVCAAFSKHSDYDNVLPKCMAALIVLQKAYKQSSTDLTPLRHHETDVPSLPPPQQSSAECDRHIPDSVTRILHEDPPTGEINSTEVSTTRPPHYAVMSSFDEIWKAVRVLSSSVFHSLDYPNPYQAENSGMPQRSSREETLRFLEQFIPCLGRLVQAIQKVVACPIEFSMENAAVFVELGQSIAQFMKVMMCQDCNITFDELRAFCVDNLCRTALIQGLSQLDRALAMIQHCASFASNRS